MSDFEKLNMTETLSAIVAKKDNIHRKLKLQTVTEEAKKDIAASYRETLKEIKEQIRTELEEIEELENHIKTLDATELLQGAA